MRTTTSPHRGEPAPEARIVVADGNALSRRGLVAVLRDGGFHVVGEATTATWAMQVLGSRQPDALVAAMDLPNSEPWQFIPAVRRQRPDMAVIALGPARSDDSLFQAMAAGASAYTSRTAMPAAILATVTQALAAPQAFIADELMAAQRRRAQARHPRLSAREVEVLNLLALGMTIPEVAARLFIAESTAKSHVGRIYVKLGVSTRSGAIMAGLAQGIISAAAHPPR